MILEIRRKFEKNYELMKILKQYVFQSRNSFSGKVYTF